MLLTIDIGTSTFKSAIWNYDGICLSSAFISLSDEKNAESLEVNPSLWLNAFEKCCQKLENIKTAQAIIISGNGPSLVPVLNEKHFDENKFHVAAGNARLWLDRRAEKFQTQVSDLMGGFVDAGFFLPKILFIKNEEEQLYDKTKYFLGCPEYLAYALTGQARTVFPCEGFDRWFWNSSVLEKLELDSQKFPAFIRPGDPFGNILPQASDYFGFMKNIPVISGGPDFFAAILASGVIKPGQACDRSGSSEGINLCTQNQVIDRRLMSYGHPVKPYWNLSGIINTTGKAIQWGCDLFGIGFDEFISLAQKSRPGSGNLIFLPYLAGERAPLWDPKARALWQGISLSTSRNEFANSVLESIGFAVRDVITVMEEKGERAEQLCVTGRLAECGVLNQIKADITGIEILTGIHKEAELLGLAIIGACYKGKYSSFAQASQAMVKIEKLYKPNPENAALYEHLFGKYKGSQA